MSVTIACIVVTYNRPRMLREALASVVNARPDEVILVDDGSTYDVEAMVERDYILGSRGIRWKFVGASPLTVEERMTVPRQGSLINKALEMVQSDGVTYLCDDDIHAEGWYDALREAWAREPERELVCGDWLRFEDGAAPTPDDPPCPMDMTLGMTAGNFAHHVSITRDRGARWPEDRFNCLDAGFLGEIATTRVNIFTVPTVGFAGWGRHHRLQNGYYSDGVRHTDNFRAVLERGYLE